MQAGSAPEKVATALALRLGDADPGRVCSVGTGTGLVRGCRHADCASLMSGEPFVNLIRRYVLDYLACGRTEVCDEIMDPEFLLYMGGHELGPRDDVYVPAVAKQMAQFPGLCMTANEVMCSGDRLALRFTQHGASLRHDGRQAAWSGIGLYFWNGTRLTANWALEDYYARRRQLADGVPNGLEPPAIAPWDEIARPSNEEHEQVVAALLESGNLHGQPGVGFDDEWDGHACGPMIEVADTVVDDLFSAGDRVAFHMTQQGRYIGGAGKPERVGDAATLRSSGILTMKSGQVVSGRVIRDRSGIFA